MSDRLIGFINPDTLDIQGVINTTSDNLQGNLNIYTLETGDGRDIELSVVGGYICWRRVGNVDWIQLVSMNSLKGDKPVKGEDYWTESDIVDMADDIASKIAHNNLLGRSLADQHPISAITGLQVALDSKLTEIVIEAVTANNLLTVNSSGAIQDTGLCCTDIATKSDVNNVVQDKCYTHRQTVPSSTWTIAHNLNKMPSVAVTDSAGNKVVGEILYIDENNVELKFVGEFSGKAYLN